MPRAKSLFPIGTSVVKVLARSAARNAVKRQLQAQGLRVSHVPTAEIMSQASAYLADHPELLSGSVRAWREGLIERARVTDIADRHTDRLNRWLQIGH